MKKIFFLAWVLVSINASSQINSPNDTNIFSYNGLADITFRFTERGSGGRAFVHYPGNILSINYSSDFSGGTLIGNDIFFKDGGDSYISSGNFGIGTHNPFSKLSIDGSITLNGKLDNTMSRPVVSPGTLTNGEIRAHGGGGNLYDDGFLRISAGGGTNVIKSYIDLSGYSTVPDMNGNIVFGTYGAERMRIDRNGNVGIGTANPTSKLTVTGNINSREVNVTVDAGADFVFENNYNLPSLENVEKFIRENKHLPQIASAEEMKKDGINLSEMNIKLLQKIEEMTLYIIEMKKEIETLKNKN